MVNAEQIKGFDKLSVENQRLFKQFLGNFMNAQGLEARSEIVPQSVRFVHEYNEKYMRFDFLRGKKESWLHVRGAYAWD